MHEKIQPMGDRHRREMTAELAREESTTPGKLDRGRILEKARDICDLEGLRALTLRRLGEELGVDATAMYRYFRNKGDLISALIDQIFFEVPKPDPNGSWRENLHALMFSWWQIYRRHEGLAQAMAGQADDEPRLFHLTDWTVRELIRAGVPEDEIGRFHQSIYNHTVGHGLVAAFSPWLTSKELRDEQQRIYASLNPTKFPSASVASKTIYPDLEEVFLFSTDLLLDAIERRSGLAKQETTT
jgi:AcrR family transcriptional regulator